MNIFDKSNIGFKIVEKYKTDHANILSTYCSFHNEIFKECQDLAREARLKYGIMTKEHTEISNDAYKRYNEKKLPVWTTFKEDQDNLYNAYVIECQKYGYYPDEIDVKN